MTTMVGRSRAFVKKNDVRWSERMARRAAGGAGFERVEGVERVEGAGVAGVGADTHTATGTAADASAPSPAGGAADPASGPLSLAAIAAALRRERRRTGLSLSELARRAAVSKSTLSQLESGVGNPSLETLWALCVALEVPFSRLFDPPRPRVQLIRAGQGPAVASSQADYQATLLAVCPPGARRDVFTVKAEPGSERASDPHMPGVVEHVVLCAGRALVGVADEPLELGPGDYTAYPGDVPHVFRALEPGTWGVLVSEHV
jgi:transcriptional regulator with XRE-family HTH domain